MTKSNAIRLNKRRLFLVGLVLLALFVRVFRFDERMRFIWDEGRDMLAIRSMIVDRDLTLFGPFNEIDGKKDFFGVFHYYLMAPALWLSDFDPRGPALLTIGLNLMAIVLAIRLFSRWRTVSLLVLGLWMSLSPLLVRHSLWPWNPNTTPFFGMVYLWLLEWYRSSKKTTPALLGGLVLGLLFQLHYFSIVLGLSWLAVLFAEVKPKDRWRHLTVFLGGFVLPNLSFVLFDLTHQGFYRNILAERLFGSAEQQLFSVSMRSLFVKPLLYGVEVTRSLTGMPFLLSTAAFLAILYEAVVSIKHFWRTRTVSPQVLIGLPFLGILGIASFSNSLIDDYHSLPFAFGILWLFWWRLRKMVPMKGAIVIGGLMAVVMLWNLELFSSSRWDQGITKLETVGQIIAKDVEVGMPFAVASFTDADTRAVRYKYFVVKEGALPLGVTEYPLSQVVYVITEKDHLSDQDRSVWELATFQDSQLQLVGQVDSLRIFKLAK